MDFLQRTPFFRLLLPFVAGILLYRQVELPGWGLYALSVLSVGLMLLLFVVRNPKRQFHFRWLFGSGIFLFMAVLALFISGLRERDNRFDHLHRKGVYQVEVISPLVEKKKSYMCRVELQQLCNGGSEPAKGKAILYLEKEKAAEGLLMGDKLLVGADFAPPARSLNPDGFDYAAYLERQGIGATSYIPSGSWKLLEHDNSFSIFREADKCRNYLLDIYRRFGISGDEFAVLAALTLGYTDDLQPELRAGYSATGAMHILSVSGMHVGVVYVVFAFLLSFMDTTRRKRVVKGILIVLFLWGYAFLTGLSAAVIRAALMFSLMAVANCFDRKPQIYNTVFASALAMLLVNPNYLFDIGFQLSYSAVLSIIFFQPIVGKLYQPTTKAGRWAWSMFAVSVAAQLGTTPFTLYYFQQFPNYFLLTNYVAIPLSALIIYLAIGLLIFSYVPYVSVAVGFLLKWLVWALNYLIVWIEHLPASVSVVSLDVPQMVLLFVALFCLSAYYYNRQFAPLLAGFCSVLMVCLLNIQVNYRTLTSQRMIVYAGQKALHVSFINGKNNQVYSTDSLEAMKIARSFWRRQKLSEPEFVNMNTPANNPFVDFQGKRILILERDYFKGKTTLHKPLEIDYLVIGNRMKPRVERILDCVAPREIVLDPSISPWYTENVRKVCKARGIGFYAVAERGAFVLNIKD